MNSQRKRAALWYGHDNAQVRYFTLLTISHYNNYSSINVKNLQRTLVFYL